MPLILEIVTPEARVYSDTVDSVVIPTVEGEVGVLPGHLPLLAQIADGELRVSKAGQAINLIVGDGFVQIAGDKVSILAENAIEEAKIDPKAVEEAIRRAEDTLKERESLQPDEVNRLEGFVRFAVAQLSVKRKR